jgi:hypothetical protein
MEQKFTSILNVPEFAASFSVERLEADIKSGQMTDEQRVKAQTYVDKVTQPHQLVPDDVKTDQDGRPHGLVVWRETIDGAPLLYTPYTHGHLHGKVTVYKSSLTLLGQALITENFVWTRPPLAHVQNSEPLASIAALAPMYVYMDSWCADEAAFKAKCLER